MKRVGRAPGRVPRTPRPTKAEREAVAREQQQAEIQTYASQDSDMDHCLICGRELIPPEGPVNAKFGVILDAPSDDESNAQRLMVGGTGRILRVEMTSIGIDPAAFRFVSAWGHGATKEEGDFTWNLGRALRLVRHCEVILACGSTINQALFRVSAAKLSGLKMTSELLPGKIIIPAPNPQDLFWMPPGELRLALTRLSEAIQPFLRRSSHATQSSNVHLPVSRSVRAPEPTRPQRRGHGSHGGTPRRR